MTVFTKNFSAEELSCPCCGKNAMWLPFMSRVQRVRDSYGRGMKVDSAYRCEKHNRAIGGASESYHMSGRAIDIWAPDPRDKWQIARGAMLEGLTVIVYDSFLHLDDRTSPLLLIGKPAKSLKAMLGLSEGRGC